MTNHKYKLLVFEHDTITAGADRDITIAQFDALSTYGYATGQKYYAVGDRRIKFKNYVGVIQVGSLIIEVLPKLDKDTDSNKWQRALYKMIQISGELRVNSIPKSVLELRKMTLLDLYFEAYLNEVETVIAHGIAKSYRKTQANLNKVKGRILFTRDIQRNYIHKERKFVEYTTYNSDNIYNQILKKATFILNELTNHGRYASRIKRILLALDHVSDSAITHRTFDSLVYTRNTLRYTHAVAIAKMIILHYSPNLKTGNNNVISLMLDMNMLYEKFVFKTLKRYALQNPHKGIEVHAQQRTQFWDCHRLTPDIVVAFQGDIYIIDTKWKTLTYNKSSIEDIRQIFAYNLYFKAIHGVLLYPHNTDSHSQNRIPYHGDFADTSCQTLLVDLFDGDELDTDYGSRVVDHLLL